MKAFFIHILCLLILTPSYVQATELLQTEIKQNHYTVAVLPFTTGQDDFESLSTEIPLLMNAYMSASSSLMFVERTEIDMALSEMELSKSGTVDPETISKVGYLTGAQILITGRVFSVQKDIMIVAKIIGVETGRTFGEVVQLPLQGNIKDSVHELSDKVASVIAQKGETLIAVDKKEDTLVKLRPLIKEGALLPSVSVNIEGNNMDLNGNDTSAQTEISWILKNLGFNIIDETSGHSKADLQITGKSKSVFGMRKGNLVSSKAHLEIKVVRSKDSSILQIEREQAVSVDLSAESAGKEAQTKAASAVIERLVKTLLEK